MHLFNNFILQIQFINYHLFLPQFKNKILDFLISIAQHELKEMRLLISLDNQSFNIFIIFWLTFKKALGLRFY